MNDDSAQDQSEDASGGLFPDAQPKPALRQNPSPGVYRVLARKYRPSRFEDLIGQEPMVRTLSNAFDIGRIHQAYMLTGVRGVGKTTTARILARAFNYELPARDGRPAIDRPTIHMDELGVHCQAILEFAPCRCHRDGRGLAHQHRRHPRDRRKRALHAGDGADQGLYHRRSAHALQGGLQRPAEDAGRAAAEHVKFLFATTEIEKVPVTVRSRCLRFDLRRVETDVLVRHLAAICDKEKVEVDHDSLALIARASEGSVRDALSLLDQAIAHGAGAPIGGGNAARSCSASPTAPASSPCSKRL